MKPLLCWGFFTGTCLGSLLNDQPIRLIRPVESTREYYAVLNINPSDPFSADQVRRLARDVVDRLGPWSVQYTDRANVTQDRYSHNRNYHHVWFLGTASFRDSVSPQVLWAAQGYDEMDKKPVILSQRASIEGDSLPTISEAYDIISREPELFAPTKLLQSVETSRRVVEDRHVDDRQRDVDMLNYLVVEDDLFFTKRWWPLSRILGENIVDMFGSDLFKAMNPVKPQRDSGAIYDGACHGQDYRPPADLDAAIGSVLELFIEAISASVRSVLKMHALGIRHCTLNFDTLLVKNTKELRDLFRGKTIANLEGSESEFEAPKIPKIDLMFRFLGQVNTEECRNQLRKNLYNFEEHTELASRSFAPSTIPEKYIRLHHDDNISLLQEIVTFAEMIGIHATGLTHEHIDDLENAHRLNMFIQFSKSTLREVEPLSGKRFMARSLTDAELKDWFGIAQQILRPLNSLAYEKDGDHGPEVLDELFKSGKKDLTALQMLFGFNDTWPWSQQALRPQFSLAEDSAALLFHRRFVEYKTKHMPQIVLDPWFAIPPYGDEYMPESELFEEQYVFGGHSVIAKGYIRESDETDLDKSFVGICEKRAATRDTQVIIKTAVHNPRYALACFNNMVRSDVNDHRRCLADLNKVDGLICNHFVPPLEFRHLAVSYEQLYDGPDARELLKQIFDKLRGARNMSKTEQSKLIKVVIHLVAKLIDQAANFWEQGYFHQDLSTSNIVVYPNSVIASCLSDMSYETCEKLSITIVDWGYSLKINELRRLKKCGDCSLLSKDIEGLLLAFAPYDETSNLIEDVLKRLREFAKIVYGEASQKGHELAQHLQSLVK